MRESERLPEPLFTPTTKAEAGHDLPMTFADLEKSVGAEIAAKLRDASLALYGAGAAQAEEAGVILADTKFEFGYLRDELLVVDEMLTPDSSRFWPLAGYAPGPAAAQFRQAIHPGLPGKHRLGQTPAGAATADGGHRGHRQPVPGSL